MSYRRETWVDNRGPPFLGAASMNKFEAAHDEAATFMQASGAVVRTVDARVTVVEGQIVIIGAQASGGQHVSLASGALTAGLASAVPGLLVVASGTAAVPYTNNPVYRSNGRAFEKIAQGIIPVVTSLPRNANDGDEVYFAADESNGVIWHLRYRAASVSAYKWECIGGPPLMTPGLGDITTTSNTDVALTNGPSITLPVAGDWEAALRLIMQLSSDSIPVATLYVDAVASALNVSAQNGQTTPSGFERLNRLAARAVLSVKVLNANSVSTRFVQARISARPIRVG